MNTKLTHEIIPESKNMIPTNPPNKTLITTLYKNLTKEFVLNGITLKAQASEITTHINRGQTLVALKFQCKKKINAKKKKILVIGNIRKKGLREHQSNTTEYNEEIKTLNRICIG